MYSRNRPEKARACERLQMRWRVRTILCHGIAHTCPTWRCHPRGRFCTTHRALCVAGDNRERGTEVSVPKHTHIHTCSPPTLPAMGASQHRARCTARQRPIGTTGSNVGGSWRQACSGRQAWRACGGVSYTLALTPSASQPPRLKVRSCAPGYSRSDEPIGGPFAAGSYM